MRVGALAKSLLILFVFLPRDVSRMGISHQGMPLIARDRHCGRSPIEPSLRPMPTEEERTGVAGVVENLENPAVLQGTP
jgi:hypothetical protein